MVARAARRLLPGQLVAADGQHHLVALAGASPLQGAPTARQAVLGHVHQRIGEALFRACEIEHQPVREIIRFRGNTSRGIHVGHSGACSPRGDLLAVAAGRAIGRSFPRKHRSKHPPPTIRTASAPLSRLSRQRLPPPTALSRQQHQNRRRPRPTRPPQSCFQRHASVPRQIPGSRLARGRCLPHPHPPRVRRFPRDWWPPARIDGTPPVRPSWRRQPPAAP